MRKRFKAFTLIEVLLTIALIGMIAGFSAIVLQSFQIRNDLVLSETNIAQTLRRAQSLSQINEGDETWGVNINSSTREITLFQGGSYATRNTTLDEVYTFSRNVSTSGLSEITFSKVFGIPSATGDIFVNASTGSSTITINEKGTIIY